MVKLEVKNTIKLLITLTIIVLIVICINYIFHLKQENIINLTIGLIVIAGWFINSDLNRSNEIAKERRAIKAEYQKKVVEFWTMFAHHKMEKWADAHDLIRELKLEVHIYGDDEDIKSFEVLINLHNEIVDHQKDEKMMKLLFYSFEENLNKFKDTVIKQFREELELGEYKK